jgi:uncharacterized membrane protein YdfJ with MMPL/SSD domain
MFLMSGSVLVSIKAIIVNVLSLITTFGASVWVFQQGHGAHLLHSSATGALDAFVMITIFLVATGCRWTTRSSSYPASRKNTSPVAATFTPSPWA